MRKQGKVHSNASSGVGWDCTPRLSASMLSAGQHLRLPACLLGQGWPLACLPAWLAGWPRAHNTLECPAQPQRHHQLFDQCSIYDSERGVAWPGVAEARRGAARRGVGRQGGEGWWSTREGVASERSAAPGLNGPAPLLVSHPGGPPLPTTVSRAVTGSAHHTALPSPPTLSLSVSSL